MQRSLVAAVVVAAACGTPPKPPSPPASPLERFTSILEHGQSLYGLDASCEEWRAEPGFAVIVSVNGKPAPKPPPPPWSVAGRFTARPADGRIYGFSYELYTSGPTPRLQITGRGGWSPAPGVTISDPTIPGSMGSHPRCTTVVDLRADAQRQDAVLVGGETWYLTQAACLHDRHGAPSADHKGCAASNPR
jgi:hypothetical protein